MDTDPDELLELMMPTDRRSTNRLVAAVAGKPRKRTSPKPVPRTSADEPDPAEAATISAICKRHGIGQPNP
jgi:hypothetical protein